MISLFFSFKAILMNGVLKMKKVLMLVIFIIISSILSGCGGGTSSNNRNVQKPTKVTQAKSDSVDVAVYIDGTYSMSGYVNYPSATVYSDGLKKIERTVTSTWKQEKVQYVKFGDSLQNLSREQFLQSNNVGFYQENDTSLQTVIAAMDPKKLNILVTDLFQTNQDIDSLIIALKKACFADSSNGMALIGVKSQFNGNIYDIGKNGAAFNYTSKEDIASYRPFYLLVMGKEADVRAFTESYSKSFNDAKLLKVAMFSKNIGNNVKLLPGKTVKNNKKEKLASMAQISTLLGNNSDILQYRLKLDEKQSGFNATMIAEDVIGSCPESYKNFTCKVEKWQQQQGKKQEVGFIDKLMGKSSKTENGAAFEEVPAKDFVEIIAGNSGLRGTDANVDILFKFNPLGIRRAEGKYRLNIAVLPGKEEYLASNSAFKEWNFGDDVAADPAKLQTIGGKTLNVDSFVKMVASLNYEMNKPGFYDVYIYLEALK